MWRKQGSSPARLSGIALAAVLAAGGLVLACDDGTSPSELIVANIVIDPPTAPPLVLAPGATIQLAAVATAADGDIVTVTFAWATTDAAVATVNASGLVTAVAPGVVTITASAQGKSASVALVVAVPGAQVIVDPLTAFVDIGGTLQLTAQVLDEDGNPVEVDVTYTSQNLAVATVSPTGLVTGVAAGQATIVVAAGNVKGAANITVEAPVASVALEPATADIEIGEVIEFVATPKDAQGQALNRPVTWTSSNPAVATVDAQGVVTGVGTGDATISAAAGGRQGNGGVHVSPQASSITVTSEASGSRPLEIGATVQLTAVVYDADGNVVDRTVTWSSSAVAVATVDANGLVTGVAGGTATITAAVRDITGSLDVRVIGEGEETTGNNLSWPVVFAEGLGITGLPVATDPGIRPLSTETDAYAEFAAIVPTNPAAAFFFSGNVPNCGDIYYCQGTASTWRAQIVDGTGQPAYDASAAWGDNIAGGSASLKVDRPIRIEVALSTTDGVTLLGYNMPYVVNPSSPDEIQGTDGTTVSQVPLIYSVGPTLTIEQLSGPGGNVIATVSSDVFKAEINVGGRIIYGAQFKPTVAGTYRLRFILATGANVRITEIGNATGNITLVSPREIAIEVQVAP